MPKFDVVRTLVYRQFVTQSVDAPSSHAAGASVLEGEDPEFNHEHLERVPEQDRVLLVSERGKRARTISEASREVIHRALRTQLSELEDRLADTGSLDDELEAEIRRDIAATLQAQKEL